MDKSQKQFVTIAVIFFTIILTAGIVQGINNYNEKKIEEQKILAEKKIELDKKIQRWKEEERLERERKEYEYNKVMKETAEAIDNFHKGHVEFANNISELSKQTMESIERAHKVTRK